MIDHRYKKTREKYSIVFFVFVFFFTIKPLNFYLLTRARAAAQNYRLWILAKGTYIYSKKPPNSKHTHNTHNVSIV